MTPAGVSPVYACLRNPSMVDFGGHLAAVFFTSGCNFRCGFCHNAALLGERRGGLTWERLGELCATFRANWVTAAVITGGEPTLQPGLPALIAYFKGLGWAVKLDTNGSRPAVLEQCLPDVDFVAMDVKAAPADYPALTGFSDMDAITRSIALLVGGRTPYELRTTVIDPFHSDDGLRELGELVRGSSRMVLQPFVPKPELPDPTLRVHPRTSPGRLREAAAVLAPYAAEVLVRGD